jgi:uncharacterized protein (DUF1501 family)
MMIYTKQHRRRFLQNVLIAGGTLGAVGGASSLARLARAAGGTGSDCYYVFAYFGGGWDVLLSLDPRDPTRFNEDGLRDHRIQPAYDQIVGVDTPLIEAGGITFGPFIGEMARHGSRAAVVRGMSMDTLTHEVGRRRFLTGKPPSGLQARGSSAATWLASRLGADDPVPHLSVQVEAYNTDQPTYASALKVQNSNDLVDLLRPSDPILSPEVAAAVDATLREEARCARARHSQTLRVAEESRLRARGLVESEFDALFDFRASNPEMEALRDHFGFTTDVGGPEAQAAVAAQSLTNGICRCVSIQAAGGLDTHFNDWATDQGPEQERGWNALARLVDYLDASDYGDGSTWLDHTTIVAFSEFMRTPLLNERGGRDHWLTNSCLLLGGNVKGGTVIGASSDVGMSPTATNLETGMSDLGGEVIRPEHVLRTLFVDAGMEDDDADMRVEPITALMRT